MAKTFLGFGKNNRSCDACTKCCEGWLTANIQGEDMYPGKPCQFVDPGVGCKIYKDRPENPCKTFECMWRASEEVPEEFSPNNTGQILTAHEINGIRYLAMVFAGKEVEPVFLSWFITFCVARQLNAEWSVNGVPYLLGNPDFIDAKLRERANFTQHEGK